MRALGSRAAELLIGAALCTCTFVAPAGAVGAEAKQFGIAAFTMQTTEAGPDQGLVSEPYLFTQAAGHPFALTSKIELTSEENPISQTVSPVREPKNVIIDLPSGLLANPQAVPHCSTEQSTPCPTDTQIGVFVLRALLEGRDVTIIGPIVNLMPADNQAAELGLETPLGMVLLSGQLVRTTQGYTLALVASDLPTYGILSIETTLWGTPAAAAHDPLRGITCAGSGSKEALSCQGGGAAGGAEQTAFLTTPSSCSSTPLSATAWVSSWEEPGSYSSAQASLQGMAYCDRLSFDPEIALRPETPFAGEPVGVDLSIDVPQVEYASAAVATPSLRNATVTLASGISINPSIGNGLVACEPTGPNGIDIPTGLNENGEPLRPEELGLGEEPGPNGVPQLAPGHCPQESIVGSAQASTPLLAHPIEGRVYMARPECGAADERACTEEDALDGKLYRLYVELDASTQRRDEGVLLKLLADVQVDPTTGQLTVRLTENPQLPISELSFHLTGGPSALLANPSVCGLATTTSDMQPWSAPETLNADPSSSYNVTGCLDPAPLNPQLTVGSVNANAGAFSPFTLTVSRGGNEQDLAGVQMHAPPGLSAMLANVPVCEAALASSGKCPETSRVGSSVVAAGAGPAPLYMQGSIYLTGAYQGAPFGLSIVTNAIAGPLDLGPIVIGARIDIDPQTAAMTISSDPLPQIVLGVPLRIQSVTLDIDRPNFIFNPTNCDPQQITATVIGAQGTSANVSNQFVVGDCKDLEFKPNLNASTNGHTSYADGASLDMKLTLPKAAQGEEANIARIKLVLPKQLASRLTTLQGACAYTIFEANPAMCPNASIVGTARAQTPMLPGELNGPTYLVAYGRRAFPSPVIVMQDDDIRIDLTGSTDIEDTGASSISFNAIPDMPIDNFELYLPRGPHSILGATTSLCALTKTVTVKHEVTQHTHGRTVHRTVEVRARVAPKLTMPSELAAQNGAIVRQSTKIAVSGCTPSKANAARRSSTPRDR
jgi:hypothetical protein